MLGKRLPLAKEWVRGFQMIYRSFFCLAAALLLAACAETAPQDRSARILFMGDSLLAWHGATGQSVSDSVEDYLGEEVIDRSVPGAQMIYGLPISGALGMSIPKQYRPGPWTWIVVNGGGNDLWLGCGCKRCDTEMDRLISSDGQNGSIPALVRRLRSTGAQVIYTGYLRSPGVGSMIEHCRNEGDELEARIARAADAMDGVYFLSLADLVPEGDRSFHAADMIHPSVRGSRTIGAMIAGIIRR